MADTLRTQEIPDGGDCPDLGAIADDLLTLAAMVEKALSGEQPLSDDVPTILADLAGAVRMWDECVDHEG